MSINIILADLNNRFLYYKWNKIDYNNYINCMLNIVSTKGAKHLFLKYKYSKLPIVIFRDHSYMYNLKLREDNIFIQKKDIKLSNKLICIETKLCHHKLLECFLNDFKNNRIYTCHY